MSALQKFRLVKIIIVLIVLTFGITGAAAIVAQSSPAGAWGTIHVDGNPAGMAIALDGISSGVVPPSGVLVLDQIPIGGHTVGAAMAGYQEKETLVEVLDGQITKIRIELTAISTGTLEINSNPVNVQVYLDDLYKGITPVTLTGVPVGDHTILLRLTGYQDWSSPVTITPGGQQIVSGTLERSAAPQSGAGQPAAIPAAVPTAAAGGLPGPVILGVFIVMAGCFLTSRR